MAKKTSGRTTRSSRGSVQKPKQSVGRKRAKDVENPDEDESDFRDDADRGSSNRSHSESDHEPTSSTNRSKRVSAAKKGKKGGGKKPSDSTANNNPDPQNRTKQPQESNVNKKQSSPIFRSRHPGLEMDTFEESLNDWTLVALRQDIAKQASKANRAHPDIDALVKTIRMQYEKRMLMAALMGGVPEAVVWKIVGEGGKKGNVNSWIRFLGFCKRALEEKLPERATRDDWVTRNKKLAKVWKGFTDDEKTVFKDPYFFALANLPDLSYFEREDAEDEDAEDLSMDHLDASSTAPKVHQLSEDDRTKYMPIFKELVDVEKLLVCHGRQDPTSSVATLQKKSLSEVQKAHHDFSVVCQRYQITYYLTAVSCGSYKGWSQTFSNDVSFAKWAETHPKIPSKFKTYIHGKTVGKEIEAPTKVQQPSDERKTRLTRQLNSLVDVVFKGNIFPKLEDPQGEMVERGWPIRIVQKPGSLLSPELLELGHRRAKGSTIQLWLKDIESGHFAIELIPEAERQPKPKKSKKKKKSKQQRSASSSEEERDEPTQSQAPQARVTNQGLADSDDEEQPRASSDQRSQVQSKKRIRDDSANPDDHPGLQPPNHKQRHSKTQTPHLRTDQTSANVRNTDEHDDENNSTLDGSPIHDD
ncbi:uncharacterized protein MELLADRAFT_88701 [Melampsora larici-populina 98AG31]|uniref:Uncharacterized protein n=1 Tax=Melampsora larici-populina (strain 98AG31 / pathotype 3-4-7) TaxID=747676 RepID=F4RSP0_MELLP|nr:uncharacterized protein MELLADRAFT_88701 [Melampsora larici-populina 98AG31]EGG04659.1 hypothetical protein MELLADRAFT_88701 [Melampsora larici-populina 98AG31]